MCFFDCKCKSLKRLGENKNNRKKHKQKHENSKENRQNRNTGFPAHEPPRKINISKGLAGRFLFSCFSFFYVFLWVFMFFFFFVFMCFFDCKCKSLKRLGENIKTTERNRKETEQLEGQQKQQKYRISSPRTSANNLCDLFAEVRGLEILYFCFSFFLFSFEFLCFFSFLCFFFFLCFRLVFSSFCIYNRKNTYKNINNRTTRRKT